ncbi:SPOR domain-containing protein [Pelagerythrobacter marensis]|uniref:SPOR domain-containing protein n=1 Tax=Pelagerythrobacter marensis TaxID=543877 RepID=A0ABZ2CYW8_9SPHN
MAGREGEYEGEEPGTEAWEDAEDNGRLELDEDERLPWLESADYEEPGVDTGRIVGFVLIALLILAAVVGGGWYLLNRDSGGDVVADGSTIEAPEGPYKERPEDPGGRIADGTGNVAPAIGEGETREGRLAESSAAQPSAGGGKGSADASDAPEGVGVQVGAFSSRETAQRGWTTLMRQTDALNGVRHRIVEGQADIGKVYRLQAIADDLASARQLCETLQADGVACQVKP